MSLKIISLFLVFMNLKVFVVQGCVGCSPVGQGIDDYYNYNYDYEDYYGNYSGSSDYEYCTINDCIDLR